MEQAITASDKKKLNSNIWKIYAASFISSLVFFIPIIVLFWQANGLSFLQIMTLQAIFAITVLVLELPTGFFADVYGRKTSLILSGAFLGAGAFAYSIGSSFYHFLIAEIIWAVGTSLFSGSDSAFLYDTLSSLKREKEYKKTMGTVFFLGSAAAAIGSITGGLIGAFSFRLAIAAFVPSALIFILIMLTAKEPPRKKLIYERGYAHALLKIVRFALIKSVEVRWLIIYSAIVGFIGHVSFFTFQPYFLQAGFRIEHIGIAFTFLFIVAAMASKFAHSIESFIGKKASLIMLPFLSAVALFLMAEFSSPFSIIFVSILYFVFGFSIPVVQDYINQIVWSDKRATVMSLNNMGGKIVFTLFAPLVGKGIDTYGITPIFTFLGITAFLSGIVFTFFLKRNKVI